MPVTIRASLIAYLSSVDDEFVLVLDDYHVVDSETVDTALQCIVDHLPQPTHLVVATREDPGLRLSRLRARDQLSEIRVADQRFSVDESRQFLTQVMGLDLSPRGIETLEDRTEGWVAGLQLAARLPDGTIRPPRSTTSKGRTYS